MAVAFHHFGFTYASADQPALHDISGQVDEGALCLLEGPTGCGKSTLLKCMHPQLAPAGTRTGEMYLFEESWDDVHARNDAGVVAYVSQHPADQIVCDAVWHEMAFGLENAGMPSNEIRRRVAEVAHYFGIESWFRRATNSLSGGQQQLLNLASALCLRPRLLLLDEPTAQLDPVAAADFAHALFRVNRELGITVIVATHDPAPLASYATQRLTLSSTRPGTTQLLPLPRINQHDTSAQRPLSTEPLIRFRNVSYSYGRREDVVLDGFSLDIAPGFIHALVGGNGSGKTTALMVAAGVYQPQRGKVINRSKRQALLPQDPKALFACDTVADELHEWQSACGYTDDDVDSMAKALGLDSLLIHHPYDISGGQMQMLALAKVLLTSPDVLLLDEPTKGLDAAERARLGATLRAISQTGVPLVIATHDLAFCRLFADDVSMIFDGQVSQTASADTFFDDSLFFTPQTTALEALLEAAERT